MDEATHAYYAKLRSRPEFHWLEERFGPLESAEQSGPQESGVESTTAVASPKPEYRGKPSGYENIARLNAAQGVTYRAPTEILG